MDLFPGRAKRLESAISICILAILFLIGLGIFIKQFDVDMSRFGISTELDTGTIRQPPLRSIVPAGFEALSEITSYNPENLYEKINGKASLYIESGFEKLFTLRFVSTSNESLWFELFVYDMAAVRNAFSVYSVQIRAEAGILPAFAYAYKTGNALFFVHGRYYIELVGSAESGELFKAMTEVAQKIRSNLTVDDDTRIAELALFPQENLVAGSIKLYLANAFGFEGLTDTFTARYQIDDETITAFISKRSDLQDAGAVAKSYYNFLIENGATVENTADKALKGKIVDFYDTTEIVFATGSFVAGIHEAENQQAAEKLAIRLINKLNETAKAKNDD